MAMNRWLRLAAIAFSCIICAGLVPGQALFIEQFVAAGVGLSKCAEKDKAQGYCLPQYMFVAQSFNVGQYVSMCLTLVQGMLFDRFGGRWMAVNGAIVVCIGILVVLIPVGGAAENDASTSSYLSLAILLTDIGTQSQGWATMSVLALFPEYPALSLSLTSGTYAAGAFLPYVFQYVMAQTGCSLFQALVGFSATMILSCILCAIFVPSLEEFLALTQGATGPPLPKENTLQMQGQQVRELRAEPSDLQAEDSDEEESFWAGCTCDRSDSEEEQQEKQKEEKNTPCQDVKKAFLIIKVHLCDHLFFWVGMCFPYGVVVFYQCMLGAYGDMMLRDARAETALPEVAVFAYAILGAVGGPLIGVVADKTTNNQMFLTVLLFISLLASTGTVLTQSWLGQEVCIWCMTFFMIVFGILVMVRCWAICEPADVGTIAGLYMSIGSVWALAFGQIPYFIEGKLPSKDLPSDMFWCVAAGTVANGVNILRICVKGLPKGPVILADDENENLKQELDDSSEEESYFCS